MRQIDYPDRAEQAEGLAASVADTLRAGIAAEGRASLALPGGTTPGLFLEALARQELDWAQVTVFPADERWVPADHPRSNAALIRRHLLRDEAVMAKLIDLYDGEPTPQAAAPGLSAHLAPHLPLTALVVGMGDDLHTASLFPGAPGIVQALSPDAPPLMAMEGPAPEREPRVSLTLPVLQAAGGAHLLIVGDSKRAALARALSMPEGTDPAEAPILGLLEHLTIHWAP
ncbi:6-phosphogluconolactonase [Paracoccus suum]|uniref:6-phosphogluconolactonase n=2 Tax=Paracoccus suum TaxID=2259340 RepID=A0A344PJP4_9RHOB|nr:6-phosphogluconolactonase [Paracoccus suum]